MASWRSAWLACASVALICGQSAQGQLINSWEGSLESWTPASGSFTLSNTAGGPNAGKGVTHGTDSLQVRIPNQGFQRWGQRVLTGTSLNDLRAAAATPLTRRLEFNVTYDTSLIPQASISYITEQIAINTNNGWSQVDFIADSTTGTTNTTLRLTAPLSRFGTVTNAITSATVLMATNSDWGANQAGNIFVDNFRIAPIIPDLNNDGNVNAADWSTFLVTHPSPVTGTSQQRFLLGDLDSDGDNDFGDFLVFEATYDEINGLGSFREMLSVPEPVWGAGILALLFFALRRHRIGACVSILVLCTATMGSIASAQLLNSWETGLEGWQTVTFGTVPATIATSSIGATNGNASLAITQSEGNIFSWDAQVNYGTGSAGYNAISNAINVGISNFQLEFDVTFRTASIPQGSVSFVNTTVALNSSGGWIQYNNVVESSGLIDETRRVAIPLDQVLYPPSSTTGSGMLAPSNQTSFYQINLGINGDWGINPGTLYYDNLRLVQTSTPGTLTLEVDRGTGMTTIKNGNSTGNFEFNYYTITSANSLSTSGWNSLDDQNIGAVDGPDPGTVAGDSPLEGWDQAGGSSATNLTEAFLLGSSSLGANTSFSLGNAYNTAVDGMDLQFRYRDLSRPSILAVGNVVYVGTPGLDGDFNNDGFYNCGDINALTGQIATGTNAPAFDLTGDGFVNLLDRDAWLLEAGEVNIGAGRAYKLGDANLDGVVDGSDFNIWNGSKFTANSSWCSGDFNADGVVDGSDFNAWNGNKFTASDSFQAVPEPVSMGLGLLAATWALWKRRN